MRFFILFALIVSIVFADTYVGPTTSAPTQNTQPAQTQNNTQPPTQPAQGNTTITFIGCSDEACTYQCYQICTPTCQCPTPAPTPSPTQAQPTPAPQTSPAPTQSPTPAPTTESTPAPTPSPTQAQPTPASQTPPAPTQAPTPVPQTPPAPTQAPTPAPQTSPAPTQAPVCPPSYLFQNFNLFAFSSITASSSDIEGRCAAAKNITLSDYSVGARLFPPNGLSMSCNSLGSAYPWVVVVGQSISMNRGRFGAGNVAYGTSKNLQSVTFNSDCSAVMNANVIDFGTWSQFAQDMSSAFNSLSTTGNCSLNGGNLTLIGSNTANSVEIFSCSGSDFSQATSFSISSVSSSVTAIVINIQTSGSISFPITSYSMFSQYASNLMWNFNSATSITAQHVGLYGTILAPQADVLNTEGQFNGQMIVNNYGGQMQGNMLNSTFCWPQLVDVTVPGSSNKRSLKFKKF